LIHGIYMQMVFKVWLLLAYWY